MAQYIDKNALMAEIERRKEEYEENYQKYGSPYDSVAREEMEDILSFIDTLEVKEVDLEKEIDDWYNTMGIPVTADALKETARHFIRLGIKSRKQE